MVFLAPCSTSDLTDFVISRFLYGVSSVDRRVQGFASRFGSANLVVKVLTQTMEKCVAMV